MAAYKIILPQVPCAFPIIIGSVNYWMRLTYVEAIEGGWLLDIADTNQMPLICGIPLVAGANLLEQYDTVGIAAKMWVETDGDMLSPPTQENFMVHSFLIAEVAD